MTYLFSINYKNGLSHKGGFTLIELLIVLVILGISMSLVAPDMFNTLQRSQAKNELLKYKAVAERSLEISFFSQSTLKLVFTEKKLIIVTVPEGTEEGDILTRPIKKEYSSSFFVFEPKVFIINNGEWQGDATLVLKESPLVGTNELTLLSDRYLASLDIK